MKLVINSQTLKSRNDPQEIWGSHGVLTSRRGCQSDVISEGLDSPLLPLREWRGPGARGSSPGKARKGEEMAMHLTRPTERETALPGHALTFVLRDKGRFFFLFNLDNCKRIHFFS